MLIGAFLVTVVWGVIYAVFSARGLCDEPAHLSYLWHFWRKQPGWPETMPHPPGYHFVVLALTPGAPSYAGARAVTGAFALLALLAFAAAWRRVHARSDGVGAATLSMALLPILQPFTGMAYTDVPALSLLLCAWWAQVAERRAAAAALLAAACLVRQTSLLWSGFFIGWDLLQAWRRGERGLHLAAGVARRGIWLVGLQLVAAATIIRAGRFAPGTQHGNALQPNIANLHLAAVLIALLIAPLWLSAVARAWKEICAHPRRSGVIAATGLGVAAVLAVTYSNPHMWNQDLWWPEVSFTLLRNWPLVMLDRIPPLRVVSGLLIVATAFAGWRWLRREPRGIELAAVCLTGAVLLATNSLVEPRYLIPPAAFALLLMAPDETRVRHLCVWFAILCAAHAPFIVLGKSLW